MDHSPDACAKDHAYQETCYSLDHDKPCDHCSVLLKLSQVDQLLEKLS